VLGELARDLGPERLADSITADELAAWFSRTRNRCPGHLEPGAIVRSFVRALHAQDASGPADAAASQRVPCDRRTLSAQAAIGIGSD
jgi:hypothetical protein